MFRIDHRSLKILSLLNSVGGNSFIIVFFFSLEMTCLMAKKAYIVEKNIVSCVK